MIRMLAEKTWAASLKTTRCARTVVLKLKTADFRVITRSRTQVMPPSSHEEVAGLALSLLEKVCAEPGQRFRLVGVGLSNFRSSSDDTRLLLFPA
jgi:DNA polymerase-4